MGKVIVLAEYKSIKQYKGYHYENYALDNVTRVPLHKSSNVETDRALRLGYMKILTKYIEKENTSNPDII